MILFDIAIRKDETEGSVHNRNSMDVHYSHTQKPNSKKMSHDIKDNAARAVIAQDVRYSHIFILPQRTVHFVHLAHKFITGYI